MWLCWGHWMRAWEAWGLRGGDMWIMLPWRPRGRPQSHAEGRPEACQGRESLLSPKHKGRECKRASRVQTGLQPDTASVEPSHKSWTGQDQYHCPLFILLASTRVGLWKLSTIPVLTTIRPRALFGNGPSDVTHPDAARCHGFKFGSTNSWYEALLSNTEQRPCPTSYVGVCPAPWSAGPCRQGPTWPFRRASGAGSCRA